MDFYDVIRHRRSVRQYRDDPVEQDKLDRILEAVRRAPTAANRQPFHFYVVRDKDTRRNLLKAYNQEWFAGAPVIICACANPGEAWERVDGKNYAFVDTAIAVEHLVLAAAAEGLGTCWIGAFQPDRLRAVLDIPEHLEPVAMTPLGYAAVEPSLTSRKSLDETVEYI